MFDLPISCITSNQTKSSETQLSLWCSGWVYHCLQPFALPKNLIFQHGARFALFIAVFDSPPLTLFKQCVGGLERNK